MWNIPSLVMGGRECGIPLVLSWGGGECGIPQALSWGKAKWSPGPSDFQRGSSRKGLGLLISAQDSNLVTYFQS